MKLETSAGPHTARQGNGREKASSFCVPVVAQFRLPVSLKKIEPVPERRDRVVRNRRGGVQIQRGGQCRDRMRGRLIRCALCFSNPLLQTSDIHPCDPPGFRLGSGCHRGQYHASARGEVCVIHSGFFTEGQRKTPNVRQSSYHDTAVS